MGKIAILSVDWGGHLPGIGFEAQEQGGFSRDVDCFFYRLLRRN